MPTMGDGFSEWLGFHEFDALPHGLEPSQGWFVTANNKVTSPAFDRHTFLSYDWDAGSNGYRAQRINDELQRMVNQVSSINVRRTRSGLAFGQSASGTLSPQEICGIQQDHGSLMAKYVPY